VAGQRVIVRVSRAIMPAAPLHMTWAVAGAGVLSYPIYRPRPAPSVRGRLKPALSWAACAVSLSIALAALVGWVISASVECHLRRADRSQYDELIVSHGQVLFQEVWAWNPGIAPNRSRILRWAVRPPTDLVNDYNWSEEPWALGGFAVGQCHGADVVLVIPLWFMLFASMPLPTWRAWRYVKRRRLIWGAAVPGR